MKNVLYVLSAMGLVMAGQAVAQLPASPWDTEEFDAAYASYSASATTSTSQETGGADVGHIKPSSEREDYIPSITYAPTNADAKDPVYVPAIDSQGNAKTGVQVKSIKRMSRKGAKRGAADSERAYTGDWRGSGTYGNLDYSGRVTTYDTAVGQEMIAPEVNTHNMNKMVQHLRDLGYKIPESYDNKFKNFTQDYAKDLRKAYDGLGHQHNPFDTMFSGFLDIVEDHSGLDMENILFNSVDLISGD